MREVVRSYDVPRWLYGAITIKPLEEQRFEPDTFANSTKYRMLLRGLSFSAPNQTAYHDDVQPFEHPIWARNLMVNLGKSGCSDINLVPASLDALCGNLRRVRSIGGVANCGRAYRFMRPYLLPRDEGLRVSVEFIRPQYNPSGGVYAVGPANSGEVTFIAKGFRPNGYPAMLAGRVNTFDGDNRGDMQLMNSADLFNNGKTEIYLTELIFKELDVYTDAGETADPYFTTGNAFNFAWMVNPTNPTFTQWMPQPRNIPTALLTPQVRTIDGGQESPLVYWFPPATYLDPKQALSIHVANTASTTYTELHACLIGELEVK